MIYAMELIKFYGLNIGIAATVGLIIVIYLIILINKRRRSKFLHNEHRRNAQKKADTHQ